MKKLYRNEENSIIGGVFGGLGDYFNIDAVILRIGFVLLYLFSEELFGGPDASSALFIIYIVLWCVTPEGEEIKDKKDDEPKETT